MNDLQQRTAAKQFADHWKGRGYEKGESQPFWMSLLSNVFGVENVEDFIKFEDQVMLDRTSFIDGNISSTHVLIEQKGLDKDLKKPIRQSDGTLLTPFQQAKRYAAELPYSQRPRWIVTCNFSTFLVYDMENPSGQPEEILLENLPKEYYRLKFLVDSGNEHLKREMEISIKAGDIVGVLYDEFLKQYRDPTNENSLKSLNMLCVRLVFCLYAEDAGIFGKKDMFHDYLSGFDVRNLRKALIELFQVLDKKEEERDPYIDSVLAEFPYVNGGLFSDENIEIPQLTEEIRDLLLSKASDDFNWSEISPTIFGAVFESTLNPETRRSGGMHYTSIENIHKVIDPLFLEELRNELNQIKEQKVAKTKEKNLREYQTKLASLKFLDPACGSGNFLTETYISLRRLENDMLECLHKGQITFTDRDALNPIKISIKQFYGIEINDFAVTVAKTALWIAESQMMKETEDVVQMNLDFLPLKSYPNITEGNALTVDWESIVPNDELNYIMGNPPFVGIRHSNENHRDDLKKVTSIIPKAGSLDYVTAWYIKATEYMKVNPKIRTAFVSTNSIVQGEQAYSLWNYILEKNKIKINFAYQTFKWSSDAVKKAAVHCVIIGFSLQSTKTCSLYSESGLRNECSNINQYLLPAPNIWVTKRKKPIDLVPDMTKGCYPTDNGNYIFSKTEKDEFIKKEPLSEKYFRRWIGSEDMLNNGERYILFLKNCPPEELKRMPIVMERVKNVAFFRSTSTKEATRRKSQTPMLLDEERIPSSEFLVIPVVSSSNRRYIPIAYRTPPDICYASAFFIEHATLYLFGILMSNVHNSWMRTVCGRLKSDYRYSNTLVYNNFPFPNPTDEQRTKIEISAKAILDARKLYPNSSLADLYDEVAMPPELRKAHQQNDKAVMQAYGFSIKDTTEASCVAELMKLYLKKISEI